MKQRSRKKKVNVTTDLIFTFHISCYMLFGCKQQKLTPAKHLGKQEIVGHRWGHSQNQRENIEQLDLAPGILRAGLNRKNLERVVKTTCQLFSIKVTCQLFSILLYTA